MSAPHRRNLPKTRVITRTSNDRGQKRRCTAMALCHPLPCDCPAQDMPTPPLLSLGACLIQHGEGTTLSGQFANYLVTIVRQKFIGLIQNRLWASLVHISMWSKGS